MYQYRNNDFAGLPYDDLTWYDVNGQPFGIASYFNSIILGDASNIVDTQGAMAVGGNFTSSRGLSLGYGKDRKLAGTGYSPDFVRFMVGGDVAMQGPLVVIGHVVGGRNFRAARGSTYMIGKDSSPDQAKKLTDLYQADGGSKYWSLSDRGNHYAVSSYDVPRFIPASRINADVNEFFTDARESYMNYMNCLTELQPNGTVTDRYQTLTLQGNDPTQNVFLIDATPNGSLDKEIRLEIPDGSLAIIKLRTGNNAHIKAGLFGNEGDATHTLYVFEDATNIYMEKPTAIWGSIFAPQAKYYANQSGGTVAGNAALGSLEVNTTSGFEFHLYPFVGGVMCNATEVSPEVSEPEQIEEPTNIAPETEIAPAPAPAPAPMPAPRPAPMPAPRPAPRPAPVPKPAPVQIQKPKPIAIPIPIPMPVQPECPVCPEAKPCPPCPTKIQPIPIPIPVPMPEENKCDKDRCLIQPGTIFGCIWGCSCGHNHEWELRLYKTCGDNRILICCEKISDCGCFRFDVPYDDFYLLVVVPKPVRSCNRRCGRSRTSSCKPMITLKNVGVANLMME